MPRNRRMKYMEESSCASGEVPESGAIFMSSSFTRKECIRRELFGLPVSLSNFVKQVKVGMILFLFDFESRELHGVFQASSDGALNIEPHAFRSSGKQFPAQVKITEKWRCRPLPESEFRLAICENYFTTKKFNFGLSKAQVQRLLKLFSLKKVERSRLRKTAVAKHTRTSESNLGNTAVDVGFGNRCAGERDGDFDSEFPFRVTSAGDLLGRRLIEKYGSGDESDIDLEYDSTKGNKYSRNRSGVFGRLVDPKMHESKDLVGYDLSMNNSIETDALANYHYDRRVPGHTASGWLENEYHEKDGIVQASKWSNHKEHLTVEADPVAAQSSVDTPYGTSIECYDPCDPMILKDEPTSISRHNLGAHAPNVDSRGSASYTANSNYVLREKFIPDGGSISDSLPSGTVQPFPDEYNGSIMDKTSSLDSDYYIPMPTEHLRYQTSTGNGHLSHSQFSGPATSEDATENMMNFDRLPYSNSSIFPSFANPLSSPRVLSPKDGVNNETTAYQPQEEFGSHFSYSNDRAVRDSRIYPSFTYPSTSRDGADMYPKNRTHNEVQAYQRHEEYGSDPFDSNKRVIQMKDHVSPAEHERKTTRKSVFSRLALPSEEQEAEKDTSPDTESVDEVMNFLNDCHEHWIEQNRPNVSNHRDFGKLKKDKIHTVEVLNNDFIPLIYDTDLLDCEERMEQSAEKLPFIDFKRRSKALKSHGNPTEECKATSEHSAPQKKKRKLMRPRLIEDGSEDNRGNDHNPVRNVLASQTATKTLPQNKKKAASEAKDR